MLFRRDTLEGIARGDVTLAFRRWKRPGAKAGGGTRTAAGVVRFGAVGIVDPAALTKRDARSAGFPDLAALRAMLGSDNGHPVYRIEIIGIEADARIALRSSELTDAEWRELAKKFARWDEASPNYFPSILQAIATHPGRAAALLAPDAGVEKLKFKQDVRKLKELGLTESLDVGYRLSPRGEAVLAKLREHRL
jgi:hypothetical protein